MTQVNVTFNSVGRDVTKQLLCDFHAKIEFLALIDCLGVKLLEYNGVQFFRALDPILGATYKEHALFMPFRHCKH